MTLCTSRDIDESRHREEAGLAYASSSFDLVSLAQLFELDIQNTPLRQELQKVVSGLVVKAMAKVLRLLEATNIQTINV
eukprot:4991008-Amphidinium_carterae.1